jgi:hypothetical protein
MSSDPRHLADWLRALFAALERAEPHSAEAIARLAGDRSAQIGLDAERARVAFAKGRLSVRRLSDSGPWRGPWGRTTGEAVGEFLTGYCEVSDAVAEGLIDLQGEVDDVRDICGIVEVLVDAATRIPEMQGLSRTFLADRLPSDMGPRRAARRAEASERRAAEAAFPRRQGWLGR